MCTVTWLHHADGFELFCNRDEKKTRALAVPPAPQHRAGVRFIAPIDPQSGGTWIAVNQFGLALCLLNLYPAHASCTALASTALSRGLLPLELITASSASECMLHLRQLDVRRFAPFTLLVLDSGTSGALAKWDGTRLAIDTSSEHLRFLTSSSFDPCGVATARHQRYLQMHRSTHGRLDPASLTAFHSSCGEPHNAYSACTHRTDVETVSFSRVTVRHSRGVRFSYSPGPPCQSLATHKLALGRAIRCNP